MATDKLFDSLSRILVPAEYLEDFEIVNIQENSQEWIVELTEKEARIPVSLQGKDVVLDGYCNTVDLLTHAFSMKKIYLRLRRRRWKERGSSEHHSNQYDLHIACAKITPSLGAFLKDAL